MPQEYSTIINKQKNLVLFVVLIGVLMSAIDTTIVILALPTIDAGLHTVSLISSWVILAYIIVITVISTQVGKLGDNYGRSKMYNFGFVMFIVGSALCGLSQNIYQLIMFRVLQSIGGGFLSANSGAIISDYFEPYERGRAFGYTSVGWNIGSILGVVFGGFLAEINWRYIFLINVPIGLFALPIAFTKIKDISPRLHERLDIIGSIILGFSLLVVSMASFIIIGSGINVLSLMLLVISALSFIIFIVWESKCESPIIDLSLFKNRLLAFSMLAASFYFTASYVVLFLLTIYLQGVRSLDPFTSSLLLLPGYAMAGIISPYMGRLSDKHGAQILATLGLIFIAMGYTFYAILLSINMQLYLISLITILTGLGTGTFFPANNSAVMANSPRDKYGMVSGVYRTLNNIGMVLSFAIALSIASLSIPKETVFAVFVGEQIGLPPNIGKAFIPGLRASFYTSTIIITLAAIMSVTRGKEKRQNLINNQQIVN